MPPIQWFPKDSISSAVVLSHYHRFDNLGHCRLRLINARDNTDICLVSANIIKKNDLTNTVETLTLFDLEEQRAAGYNLCWEGDIEIMDEDVLVIAFIEIGGSGYPTDGDVLKTVVGIEYVKP